MNAWSNNYDITIQQVCIFFHCLGTNKATVVPLSHVSVFTDVVSQRRTSPSDWIVMMEPVTLTSPFLHLTMWLWDLVLWLHLTGFLLPVLIVLLIIMYSLHQKDPPNFPPGPPALPLLGNIFNIEAKQPHLYLTKVRWSSYRDILKSLGVH